MTATDEYALWRDKTDDELAADHILGRHDPKQREWWIRHWTWRYSARHDQLCRISEAVQVLAWEADLPTLTGYWSDIFTALHRLNKNVRGNTFALDTKRVYWLKREALKRAMEDGLVQLRRVECFVKCHTCGGTGVFDRWDGPWDDDQNTKECCRRCRGKGQAHLEFFECNVANRFQFHLPSDHRLPFPCEAVDRLMPHSAGAWRPNKPSKPMFRDEIDAAIAMLKERLWDIQPERTKEIYELW